MNYSGFVSRLIAGIIFWDETHLSGGFYHLVLYQGNLIFAIFSSEIVMRLNSLREFLNSKMHVAELWIFENSLVFYSEEKDIQFHCNSRPFFIIIWENSCERLDGCSVSCAKSAARNFSLLQPCDGSALGSLTIFSLSMPPNPFFR